MNFVIKFADHPQTLSLSAFQRNRAGEIRTRDLLSPIQGHSCIFMGFEASNPYGVMLNEVVKNWLVRQERRDKRQFLLIAKKRPAFGQRIFF